MTRIFGMLLTLLLVGPAFAKQADPAPKTSATPPPKELPSAKGAATPAVVAPPIRELEPARKAPTGKIGLPPRGSGPKGTPVPLEGRMPLEPVRPPTRPSGLPLEVPGADGLRSALSRVLRVDGRTGSADLRGRDPAVARVEWQLDAPESDLALISVRREAGGRCPAAGTSLGRASEQLRSDPSVVAWDGWVFSRGNNRTQFSGSAYQGLTDVYVQACGIQGNAFNGVASNVVRVRIGSAHQVLRLPAARWSVEWSSETSSNAACLGSLDTSVIPPPRGQEVGFRSHVARGSGPIPCVRDTLYVYQPSVGFDVGSLPRDARILRAELRFTETDPERQSASGRLCTGVTRRVGLATSPVRGGNRHVEAVSGRADDERAPTSSTGWRRQLDVADWVAAWQGGRAADLTFLGPVPRREGAACQAQIADVHIFVEYE